MGSIGLVFIGVGIVGGIICWRNKYTTAGLVGIAIAIVGMVILTFAGIRIIDATEVGIPIRLGKVQEELLPGPHLVNPLFTRVVTIDRITHSLPQGHSAYTKDGQVVDISTETQYALATESGSATFIYNNYGGTLENAERKLAAQIAQAVREVTSQYTGMELIIDRSELGKAIEQATIGLGADMHIVVGRVLTTNLDFSESFEDAIDATMTAQQEKKRQEVENETRVALAIANKNVAIEEAAAAVERANGEAKAMAAINEAMQAAGGSDAYLRNKQLDNERELGEQYLAVLSEKWNGVFPSTYTGIADGEENPFGMGGVLFNIGGGR